MKEFLWLLQQDKYAIPLAGIWPQNGDPVNMVEFERKLGLELKVGDPVWGWRVEEGMLGLDLDEY